MTLHLLRALLLLTLLLVQTGCAQTDADLGYTRDSQTPKQGDNSYHGWNDANN
jgi:hypothetical protein